jgi:hypothetical protein
MELGEQEQGEEVERKRKRKSDNNEMLKEIKDMIKNLIDGKENSEIDEQ